MKSNSLIPIPLRQRWFDFKTVYLPVIVFGGLCLSIMWMWGRVVAPTSVIGEVESLRANVISTVPGKVVALNVSRMDRVTNGQCVIMLSAVDTLAASNELAVIEADLKILKTRTDISSMGNAGRLAEARISLLDERVKLSMAKVNLVQAQSECIRMEQLFKEKLVPAGGDTRNTLEVAQRDRDLYKAEVEQRTILVEHSESELNELQKKEDTNSSILAASIEKAIDAQKRSFESLNLLIPLKAPMDGYVSSIRCQNGEQVSAGTPLVVIASENAEHVIAWVRQPVTTIPKIGDVVKVRRPLVNAKAVPATIIKVGGQFEPLSPGVMPMNFMSNRVETGLPFMAQLPKNTKLIPGEPVQLDIPRHPRTDDSL
jgi:multidrug resistance efflux pump